MTTIEKFRVKTDTGEVEHPELSSRSNLIVIADEAHRSQYGFDEGYARNLAEALPNAMRLGFTGTPFSLSGADTVQVFGDVIHTYDIEQSQKDHATVPIYYEPRLIKLRLGQADIDRALGQITQGQEKNEVERRKGQWAALAQAAGAQDRVDELARDLLAHFLDRTATLRGKAMVVCMTRENCVRVYDALQALPDCPEIKIVMTSNPAQDPPAWAEAGHSTTKAKRQQIKQRMIDPDDPLKLVIVCDMWLTGTDIPCLHTLYMDKPMQGHTMIQAISRVNRVFADKPHGLIVDYIGIGDELREATAQYTQGGGKGDPAPDIESTARPLFMAELQAIRALLPAGHDYGAWRRMTQIEMEDLYALVYGHLAGDDQRRDDFLQAELRLTSAFLLVKSLDECRKFSDEVIFYQRVRKQIAKTAPGAKPKQRELERAVRDLVDDSVEDEIQLRRKQNITRARPFKELLEATLQKYHNRLIDAAEVVRVMIQIRQDMAAEEQRAQALGLDADELAFYDAVAVNFFGLYDEAFLRDLIHDVVHTVKNNLKVDWTESHREDVKATVRAAVRRELRKRNVRQKDLEPFLGYILDQAREIYADWPLSAYATVNDEP